MMLSIGIPIICTQKIGARMIQLHIQAVELRMLMGLLHKHSHQALQQLFAERNIEISGLQFGILHVLAQEPQTISELSRKFLLDPSTLVPTIDALERKGYVARQRDPNDRRRVPVLLTESGREILESAHMMHDDDPLFQCLRALGPQKAEQLLTLMRDMVAHLPEGQDMLESIVERLRLYSQRHSGW